MKQIILAAILSFGHVAEACRKDIRPINVGETSDCKGFLISPKMENYYNSLYEDLELKKKQLSNNEELVVVLKLKVDELKNYTELTEKYAVEQVKQAKEDTTWGWIKGGVIGLLVGGLVGALVAK